MACDKNHTSELKASTTQSFQALAAFPLKSGIREATKAIRGKIKLRSTDARSCRLLYLYL